MLRSQPLRRSPLKRTARQEREIRRTVAWASGHPPKKVGVPKAVVALVLARCERDGVPCCEVCSTPLIGERGAGWSLHHRRFRDGRPDSHFPSNILVVCGASNVDGCHGRIHRDKAEALTNGWAISRHGFPDPRLVPVLIDHLSRWVYFTEDGGYEGAGDGL